MDAQLPEIQLLGPGGQSSVQNGRLLAAILVVNVQQLEPEIIVLGPQQVSKRLNGQV
jgi:hypothetical protein